MKPSWLYWGAGALGAAGIAGLVLGLKGAGVFEPQFIPGPSRSPQDILNAVAAVNPEGNPTLQRGYLGQPNWCNRFLYLVCSQLGVPMLYGEYGTRANDQVEWMDDGNDGWFPIIDAADAQAKALEGYLVAATYYNLNPFGSGHVAVVLPLAGAVQIAQAGARVGSRMTLSAGFGSIQPVFYGHA